MFISGCDGGFTRRQEAKPLEDKETLVSKFGEEYLEELKNKAAEEKQEAENIRREIGKIAISNRTQMIDAKLKGGEELTAAEMQFLKKNNPDLYMKAQQVKRERNMFRKQLESCQTKDDVAAIHLNKINSLATMANKIKNNPNLSDDQKKEMLDQVQRRTMAIQNEYSKFINTKKYRDLPTREELLRGKKAKVNGSDDKKRYSIIYNKDADKKTGLFKLYASPKERYSALSSNSKTPSFTKDGIEGEETDSEASSLDKKA